MKNQRNKKRDRLGATTVEFALVFPLLILIVFGLLEWGRFEMCRQVSSTAAFNAARLGSIPGSTSAEVEARAAEILDIYFINGATVTANLTEETSTVQIGVPMNQNSIALLRFFGDVTIQREFTLSSR